MGLFQRKKEVGWRDLDNDQKELLRYLNMESDGRVATGTKWVTPTRYLETYHPDLINKGSITKRESERYKYKAVFKELENLGLLKSNEKSQYAITRKGSILVYDTKDAEIVYDTDEKPKDNLASRVSAFIFLLAGLFFMALPEFTATGNVIGSSSTTNISFFLSLGLMIIGGVLLFRSFRKK